MARRYGMVIDLERCIGCNTCIIACKLEHGIEKGSGIRVDTIGGPHRDTPEGKHPNLRMHFLPVPCMHCERPACIDACAPGAITKREDGVVFLDESKCNNCQACITVCPYDALFVDAVRDVVRKCNLCAHRLDEGLDPFCVVCCETEAMYVGDLNDPQSEVSRLIKERGARTLKPEADSGPAVYFIPTRDGRVT